MVCALQYCVCVGLIFFCELATGVVIFVYKDWVSSYILGLFWCIHFILIFVHSVFVASDVLSLKAFSATYERYWC